MWELMIRVVNAAKMHIIIGWFVASVVSWGVTLALVIPFLRALYARSESLIGWLVAMVTLGVVTFVIGIITTFRSCRVSIFKICDMMIDRVTEHVLALPFGWFNTKRETVVVNVVSKEINILSHLCSMITPNLCNAFTMPLVMPVAVGIVGRPLALVMAIAIIPLYLVWWMVCSAATRANEAEDQVATTAAERPVESARLRPVSWAIGMGEKGWKPAQKVLEANPKTTLDGLHIKSRSDQFLTLVLDMTFVVVLALELLFVNRHRLDVIVYLVIIAVIARILLPSTKNILYALEADSTVVTFKAIISILNARPLPEPSPEQVREPRGTDIVLRDVSFSYKEGRSVLDRVSLVTEQGRVTAFASPSGAGKSMVLRLATRLWDVTARTVSIGGVDMRRLLTVEIIAITPMIFQKVYLFDTTVCESLRIIRPDTIDKKLGGAARRASLDKVIRALPHGWGTPAGPSGVSLSGGERQWMSITRALLKDTPTLLFDEITSALDSENESVITKVIRELSRGRTMLVVARRLSTIRQANRVVFLKPSPDDARVTQVGTMPELIAQEGPFRGFVETYTMASRW